MTTTEPRRESSAGYHLYSLYRECPRKWFIKYVLGLIPNETAPALIFGAAMHKGLEAYYTGSPNLDAMVGAFTEELSSREAEYLEGSRYLDDLALGPRLLTSWYSTWSRDLIEYDIIEAEKEHVIHFGPEDDLILTVRLDQLLRHKATGIHYVKDLKTTGWSDGKMFQQTDLADQMTCYIWAANRLHDFPVHDAIVDILYYRGAKTTATRPSSIYRTNWDLLSFELGIYGTIHELSTKVDQLVDVPPEVLFPRQGKNCGMFGCEYQNICRGRLTHEDVPLGFHRDPWYQAEVAENIKHVDFDKVIGG